MEANLFVFGTAGLNVINWLVAPDSRLETYLYILHMGARLFLPITTLVRCSKSFPPLRWCNSVLYPLKVDITNIFIK